MEALDFYELIANRESIRSYDPSRKLPEDILCKIAEAGRIAPSAANLQPWHFIIVTSPAKLKQVQACYPRDWFKDAPHILVVAGDRNKAWTRSDGYNSLETDLAIAMDHMILMAESLGVATCWGGNFNYTDLRKALGLSDHEKVFALTPLGYPPVGFIKKGIKHRNSVEKVCCFL